MLGSVSVNGVQYNLIKPLNLGEHRKINGLNAKLNRINNQIKETKDEEKTQQLTSELMIYGNEQLEIICDFLEIHTGITQEELNLLSLEDAIQIFQEVYKALSTPDKDIKKT